MTYVYTNTIPSGFTIAEAYERQGSDGSKQPDLLRRAWFADLDAAERFMREGSSRLRAIVADRTESVVAYAGMISQADPYLGRIDDLASFLLARDRGGINPSWR